MRRTADDAAVTRAAIVDAARRSFAEHGFAATTVDTVAAAVGVTKGALYHHFTDKQALFRAVFVELEHELDSHVNAVARTGTDALGAFALGCGAWLDFAARPDYQRIAAVEAPAVLGVTEWHAIDSAIGITTMSAGLRALHRAGHLAASPSPARTILLFGALTEAGLALARGEGHDRQGLLDEFLALVLGEPPPAASDGVAARRGRAKPQARVGATPREVAHRR
jgi:AcrR family transcriptional regulator